MNKHRHLRHLLLLVGLLMMTNTAAGQSSTAAEQSNTAAEQSNTAAEQSNTAAGGSKTAAGPFEAVKPGEPVERHLSDDETFREWSLDPKVTDGIKRIKVCRVDELCKMRFKEGQTPRMRVK